MPSHTIRAEHSEHCRIEARAAHTQWIGADDPQLSAEERAAIAKSFNDKSEPKKVISEGVKVNGVKYMTIEASDDSLKAKKVTIRRSHLTVYEY
jgi:hypothetical protein